MRLLLIGVAIDILKWVDGPIYKLRKMTARLMLKRIDSLVPLQFRYFELQKQQQKAKAAAGQPEITGG